MAKNKSNWKHGSAKAAISMYAKKKIRKSVQKSKRSFLQGLWSIFKA